MSKENISEKVILSTLEMSVHLAWISMSLFAITAGFVYLNKITGWIATGSIVCYLLAQIFCIMLNYDKKLFKILLNEKEDNDIQEFDEALKKLWNKEIKPQKTLEQRFKGTAKLIKTTFVLLLLQGIFLAIICF